MLTTLDKSKRLWYPEITSGSSNVRNCDYCSATGTHQVGEDCSYCLGTGWLADFGIWVINDLDRDQLRRITSREFRVVTVVGKFSCQPTERLLIVEQNGTVTLYEVTEWLETSEFLLVFRI